MGSGSVGRPGGRGRHPAVAGGQLGAALPGVQAVRGRVRPGAGRSRPAGAGCAGAALVGELVRRADGRGPGRFLREEVCGPLGLDFFVGLTTAERARAVDLTGLEEYSRQRQAAGMPQLYRRAMANPPGAFDPVVVNGSAWRAAEVPAVNGHGTARAAIRQTGAVLVVTGIALFIMLLLVRNFFGVISVLFNGGIVVLVLWYGSVKLQIIAAYALGWFLLFSGVRFAVVHGSNAGRRSPPRLIPCTAGVSACPLPPPTKRGLREPEHVPDTAGSRLATGAGSRARL